MKTGYPYLDEISQLTDYPKDENEKKANIFFDDILSIYKPFIIQLQNNGNQKIVFITVSHIVRSFPYFMRAISHIAPIVAVIPKGASRRQYRDTQSFYLDMLQKYSAYIRPEITREKTENIKSAKKFLSEVIPFGCKAIIIDEGGYFAFFVKHYKAPSRYIQAIVEITKNGHYRYDELFKNETFLQENKIFISSIAVSPIKENEDKEVGPAILRVLDYILDKDSGTALKWLTVGIFGCGVIGSGIAKALDGRAEKKLLLYDITPENAMRTRRYVQRRCEVSNSKELFLSECDLIISATGRNALSKADIAQTKDGVQITCVTSKDDELGSDALEDYVELDYSRNELITTYAHKSNPNRKIYIILGGNAVNFVGNSVVGPGIYAVLVSTLICALRGYDASNLAPVTDKLNQLSSEDIAIIESEHIKYYGHAEQEIKPFDHIALNAKFTDRKNERRKLFQPIKENLHKTVLQAIVGLGGSGKSWLAKGYIDYSVKHKSYDYIAWLQANDILTLTRSFKKLAKKLDIIVKIDLIDDLIDEVYAALEHRYYRVLLIFDNAAKDSDIKCFIREQENKLENKLLHIVVTSRNLNFFNYPHENIHLSYFSPDESYSYVSVRLNTNEKKKIIKLVNMLHHFPLALGQAIAFLCARPHSSIDDYCDKYRASRKNQNQYLKQKLHSDEYQETILSTWDVSFNALTEKLGSLPNDILRVCTFFSPVAIPVNLINEVFLNEFGEAEIDIVLWNIAQYDFIQWDLVAENQMSSFSIHPLVHEVICIKHMEDNYFWVKALKAAYRYANKYSFLPILHHCIQLIEYHFHNPIFEYANELFYLAKQTAEFHCYLFLEKDAIKYFELASRLCEENSKIFDNNYITIQLRLANTWGNSGDPLKYCEFLESILHHPRLKISHVFDKLKKYDLDVYQNTHWSLRWLLKPISYIYVSYAFKVLTYFYNMGDLLIFCKVPQLGIVYLIYSKKLLEAKKAAMNYLSLDDSEKAAANYYNGLINVLLNNLGDETLSYFLQAISDEVKGSGSTHWDQQIYFFASVMYAVFSDFIESKKMILLFSDILKRRNLMGYNSVRLRVETLENIIKFFIEKGYTKNLNPILAQSFRLLAGFFSVLNNPVKSSHYFERSLECDSSCILTYYEYGRFLFRENKYSDSINIFTTIKDSSLDEQNNSYYLYSPIESSMLLSTVLKQYCHDNEGILPVSIMVNYYIILSNLYLGNDIDRVIHLMEMEDLDSQKLQSSIYSEIADNRHTFFAKQKHKIKNQFSIKTEFSNNYTVKECRLI